MQQPSQKTASLLSTSLVSLSPANLILAAPGSDKTAVQYLQGLAALAKDAAEDHACGSVLAGQGSEADDFGDIAFWLGTGKYDQDNANRVMDALGLDASQIRPVPLTHAGLPTAAFNPQIEGGEFIEELKRLGEKYCIRASIPGEATVVFVLVGQYGNVGWGGLIGAGIWSDCLSD
ncbi:hypothetical protein D9611_000164 [Ephemerocybe angulata]|uniref:Uncharacterized protein n=1 Tax=Ephemerocybe angulata TaxID=980116 RepID=A0A8H5F6N6_9AGAR|nr:hypothetical protein D9611_000164 [Tulosesus angulatus]